MCITVGARSAPFGNSAGWCFESSSQYPVVSSQFVTQDGLRCPRGIRLEGKKSIALDSTVSASMMLEHLLPMTSARSVVASPCGDDIANSRVNWKWRVQTHALGACPFLPECSGVTPQIPGRTAAFSGAAHSCQEKNMAKIAKTADRKKVMDTSKSTACPKCGKDTRIVKRTKDRERGVPGGVYISCSACEFYEKL